MLSTLQQDFLCPHLSDAAGASSKIPLRGSGGFDPLRA